MTCTDYEIDLRKRFGRATLISRSCFHVPCQFKLYSSGKATDAWMNHGFEARARCKASHSGREVGLKAASPQAPHPKPTEWHHRWAKALPHELYTSKLTDLRARESSVEALAS